MNTPLTNELEKLLIESNASSDIGKFQRMASHARDLECKVQQLVAAIEIAEQHIAYGRNESAQSTLLDAIAKHKGE